MMAADTQFPQSVAERLTLALIASSDAPLLLLDGDLRVIAASRSFGRAFQIGVADAPGRLVFDLGAGEWDWPQVRSLLIATAAGQAAVEGYEMDLNAPAAGLRRLVIKAEKLSYGDPDTARVLMTVADVTDARLAERVREELVREKAVLLQEVQHRVANSLQIIASVLLQSARNVQSEETRSHLNDAHNRVMSIATVQRQLAQSHVGEVELGPYITQLCKSLGASMIPDHAKQSIAVTTDNSRVGADISVSLGLIVTELVINALKHAFTENGEGAIFVDYRSQGPNWTLSVADNGIGMRPRPNKPPAGLGSSIVEALSRQLRAKVRITSRQPGTTVSIVHTQVAGVDDAGSVERAI